ncbi:MAG: PAS domain-containing protein [Acidobacteria bacterium]|nr:PAS domain-containing protein [Acidobacteriota bacterium]
MRQSDYLDILCNTADGVFITDAHKRVVRWNQGAEKILGIPESDTLHRSCYQVISGKAPGRGGPCGQDCAVHRSGVEGTPRGNFDLEAVHSSGRPVWINVTLLSSTGSESPLVTHILRDVTRDRRMEFALDRFLAELKSSGSNAAASCAGPAEGCGIQPPRQAGRPAFAALSAREFEVLTLLAEGLSTKALARKLDISHYTARNHIQNILVKLDLHSKAQAVSFAFKQGIL